MAARMTRRLVMDSATNATTLRDAGGPFEVTALHTNLQARVGRTHPRTRERQAPGTPPSSVRKAQPPRRERGGSAGGRSRIHLTRTLGLAEQALGFFVGRDADEATRRDVAANSLTLAKVVTEMIPIVIRDELTGANDFRDLAVASVAAPSTPRLGYAHHHRSISRLKFAHGCASYESVSGSWNTTPRSAPKAAIISMTSPHSSTVRSRELAPSITKPLPSIAGTVFQ